MTINNNFVNVSNYRGPVRLCEHCHRPNTPDALLEFCKFCLAQRYLATCLKCDGDGMIKGIAPWDGKSEYKSPCDICGGSGCLPAKKPSNWDELDPPKKLEDKPQPAFTPHAELSPVVEKQLADIRQERLTEEPKKIVA
jgi:hypothetical protein